MPVRATFADMKGPSYSPLTIARLAADDSPSLREVARVMGVSAALLSKFELGHYEIGAGHLEAYAKAIGRAVDDVRIRFVEAALLYHTSRAKELRVELLKRRKRGLRPGRPPKHHA